MIWQNEKKIEKQGETKLQTLNSIYSSFTGGVENSIGNSTCRGLPFHEILK